MHKHHSMLILTLTILAGMTGAAQAKRQNIPGIQCAVDTTELVSATIGNINNAPELNNILGFSCNFRKPLEQGHQVYYCWHIHDAPSGTAKFTSRYATYQEGASKAKIGFNIYSHGLKVGDRRTLYNITGQVSEWTSSISFKVHDPITVKWEGNQGITLPIGHYLYNNPQTHFTAWDADPSADPLDYLNACGASNGDVVGKAETKGNTIINVAVKTYCNAKADDMNFSKQFSLQQTVTATANVYVDCSAGTDFDAAIDMGNHALGNIRRMQRQKENDSDEITYIQYFIDPEKWHDIGLGWDLNHAKVKTITGTVPPQPNPYAGTYKDQLKIIITYYNRP